MNYLSPDTLKQVAPAMSKDEYRTTLRSVYLCNKYSKMIATDGHRMHIADILYDGPSIMIPFNVVRELIKCNEIEVGVVNNELCTKTEQGEHWFEKNSGNFPNYYSFIPQRSDLNSVIEDNRLDLIAKLEKIKPFVNKKTKMIVFKDGVVQPKLNEESLPDFFESEKIEHQKGCALFLNVDFLLDAITKMNQSTVCIRYKTNEDNVCLGPTVINDSNITALIMSMRG
jgi:DNA polymerase III sliding clamp (beta) subunit (PCNA family)